MGQTNHYMYGDKPALPIIIIPKDADTTVERVKVAARPAAEPDRAREMPIMHDVPDVPVVFNQPPNHRVNHVAQTGEEDEQNVVNSKDSVESFWKMIASFNWCNLSDGRVNIRLIQNTIRVWHNRQRELFMEKYRHYFVMMKTRLEMDDMFARNNIDSAFEQARIISHSIAMGKDQFYTLFDDPAFFQFFIETGECQSLDVILPIEMRCE